MSFGNADHVRHVFALDEALWLAASFSTLNRKVFSPALFAQRFPTSLSSDELAEAAQELGFVLNLRRGSLAQVLAWRMPLAAQLTSAGDQNTAWVIVLNADETRASILAQGATEPEVIALAELARRFTGHALAMSISAARSADPDGIEFQSGRFGLRWFVPELLKHRRIWRDVLLASLALQLMALAQQLQSSDAALPPAAGMVISVENCEGRCTILENLRSPVKPVQR